MSTYMLVLVFIIIFFIFLYKLLNFRDFDKYFQLNLEESYDLNKLFSIRLTGKIVPRVSFLEIPYEELNIDINKKTIRGTIKNNVVSLEFIRIRDKKRAVNLIKLYYMKKVAPYIKETIKAKKEDIELIKMAEKEKDKLKKIACQTCKHRMQCQISLGECNYERRTEDKILNKGIRINNNINYEFDYHNN